MMTRIRELMMLICLFIFLITSYVSSNDCRNDITWRPSWLPPRNDLCCHRRCKSPDIIIGIPVDETDQCCRCNSFTTWRNKQEWLDLEYVSVAGKSLVLPSSSLDDDKYYGIEHTSGAMTDIPSNICEWEIDQRIKEIYEQIFYDIVPYWERIVTIDFSNNRIKRLLDLTCLKHLDTLNLSGNNIKHLSKASLANLSLLRIIDISYNKMLTMEPEIVASRSMRLFHIDFSYNELSVADVTNIISLYPFCTTDFTRNRIKRMVNEENVHLNLSEQYGPGFVKFNYNLFRTFPDFKTLLGLDSLLQLGTLFGFGFDFRDIQLECDCNIARFLNISRNIQEMIWRNYFAVVCKSPEQLNGQYAFQVDLNQLVCVYEVDELCPLGCECVDRPNTNTLYVNCQNIGLTALPEILPESNFSTYISLNVAHNRIKTITNASYLRRLSILNISHNSLDEITKDVADILENVTLDLSYNRNLRSLPNVMQYRKSCSTTFMKNVYLHCACDHTWLEQWVSVLRSCSNAHSDILFLCDVPGRSYYVNATSFTKTMLTCGSQSDVLALITPLAAAILVLAVCGFLAKRFKYEILIIFVRLQKYMVKKSFSVCVNNLNYDLAILFNEEDDKLRLWVMQHLVGALETEGYRVFVPFRDLAYGSERDSETVDIYGKTKSFVLVLSESYVAEPDPELDVGRSWTENEWKYAWNQYIKNRRKQLVIVNYDYIMSSTINHAQISAYLRVGNTVVFDNHNATIMDEVFKKLGKPIEMLPRPTGNDNKAKKFIRSRSKCDQMVRDDETDHDLPYKQVIANPRKMSKTGIWTTPKIHPYNDSCDDKSEFCDTKSSKEVDMSCC